jgi:dimeric dUTPase (all-alpha-NTP-PPase superfamily)
MTIDLGPLFAKQRELDAHIHANHALDYPSTRHKRILALLVELGELANETRAFKFWSLKAPSPIEKILDEYADGMHFFLSLGIDIGSHKMTYLVKQPPHDFVHQTLLVYHSIDILRMEQDTSSFEAAFQTYLDMIPLLGVSPEEVIAAYYQKLGVNYKRQEQKY